MAADELRAYLFGEHKIYSDRESLAVALDALREQGKRIVFTNGVFDILHSAHVSYLSEARTFGDALVVGVNTDDSVRRLKGPERPINSLVERCLVLAGLCSIDYLVPFGEDTPVQLIQVLRPDIYVKGGDYTRETLPETPVMEAMGGVIRIVPYVQDHSTTRVIERIKHLSENRT